ncbi:MAG: tetratricopeptide repeat protein [Treponema sp.]|nr:tetratricopeptide repeat protein [Treponema sp.]MCL2245375.1 tetratricopeptide repeat protein [Treponema sp.]
MKNDAKLNPAPPVQEYLKSEYEKYAESRQSIVSDLRDNIENILKALDSNPVITGRIKNFPSYFSKYIRLLKHGEKEPLITDLMGVRIICPFIEDLQAAEKLLYKNFTVVEREVKGHYNFKEFGYESTHLLVKIPAALISEYGNPGTFIVEIQIRTILQDAWAEVEHELVYKAQFSPFDDPMKRKLAAVNASLSLADIIFQEIRSYQRKFSREIGKRRESFYQKIEESTDDLLFSSGETDAAAIDLDIDDIDIYSFDNKASYDFHNDATVDDLLVDALSAHNENRFNDAISQYTKILELKPDNLVRSIIFKHRGMAHFACSQYDEAINDFTSAIELDPGSYKAAYYRGVVYSVIRQYSQAIDDYTFSLSINSYQSFCLFRRGQAYYHIGDYPQALADCENSLALEPGNKSVVRFKDLLHSKLRM